MSAYISIHDCDFDGIKLINSGCILPRFNCGKSDCIKIPQGLIKSISILLL